MYWCHSISGKKITINCVRNLLITCFIVQAYCRIFVQGMPKHVKNAKIACLDMNLQKARMHMGVQVLVSDPAELEKIRSRESDIVKERIEKLLSGGANVVLTTKGIDDLSLKYFVEAGALACRRVTKEDLR